MSKIKNLVEMSFKFKLEDKETALKFREHLHNQWVGNKDYIDSKIIISSSDDIININPKCTCQHKKDEYEVFLIFDPKCDWSKVPALSLDVETIFGEEENNHE